MDDKTLRAKVAAVLAADLRLTRTHVEVTARDGIVTLSGCVGSLAEKVAATRCVARIPGIAAVLDLLAVVYPLGTEDTEDRVRRRATAILDLFWGVPKDAIEVSVDVGVVTLNHSICIEPAAA